MKNNLLQPTVRTPEKIDIPAPESIVLPNGVKIHILDCSEQDVIRFSFVFRAGTSLQEKPFSASTTANVLSEGTARHSAQEIAEILDFHGSYFDVSLDRDYAVITFVSLLKFFPQTLETAREILLSPTFPEEEISSYCKKRKQRLAVERSKIAVKARELFASSLFGKEHPYGISHDQALYDDLKRSDITEFYHRRYTAENCFVVCSGKIDTERRHLLSSLAAEIPRGGDASLPAFAEATPLRFVFERWEGAVQSSIRIGTMLFPRPHPDFIAMQVVATVLGGYFGSRLVKNLREEHGYTYGVYATVVNLEFAGYLAIATDVAAEATSDALRQILREIEILRSNTVSEEELQMVKNIMIGEIMRILDGPFGIADVTIENIENGMGNDYLDRFLAEVRGITPQRVAEVARQYLDTSNFTTVVVGNPDVERSLDKQ